MNVRDQGFGLNYNQGFGGGRTIMADNSAQMQGSQNAWNLLGQGRQNAFTGEQNDANRGLQRYLGDQGNATQRYGIDQSAATTRQGNTQQYNLGMRGLADKQGRFNQVFGLFGDTLANGGGLFGRGLSGGYQGGGAFGAQPHIDAGPVLNPQQIQQQVNAARSGNDQALAGQQRQMQSSLAGRGFGANSPLAMALSGNMFGQNLATNAANERDTRINAAQLNSGHVLEAQKAQEGQYANRQQEEIERGKAYTGGLASLLGAFGGMVG